MKPYQLIQFKEYVNGCVINIHIHNKKERK